MPDGEGQHPVAEAPACFVEHTVGLAIDDAVDPQPTLLLEAAHRAVDRLVKQLKVALDRRARGVGRRRGQQPQLDEAMPQLQDGGATRPKP